MNLIVGLGNPGLKYRNTRHNAGFAAIDALAEKAGLRFNKKRFQGVVAEGKIGGKSVLLLKPHTYMNLSGEAVAEAMRFYKLTPQELLVIYDDIDLDLGRLRIKAGGSAGSHNGMRSIVARVGSEKFPRLRIGIGKPKPPMDLAAFVLQKLRAEQKKAFLANSERAAEAALEILRHGVEEAQQKYNGAAL